jgi:putative FmdB family regulatory protein
MPIYEYKCTACGRDFEELVPVSQRSNPPCPACGSAKTEKKMSIPGGSGSAGSSCGSSGFS